MMKFSMIITKKDAPPSVPVTAALHEAEGWPVYASNTRKASRQGSVNPPGPLCCASAAPEHLQLPAPPKEALNLLHREKAVAASPAFVGCI